MPLDHRSSWDDIQRERIAFIRHGLKPHETGLSITPSGNPIAVNSEGDIFEAVPMEAQAELILKRAREIIERAEVVAVPPLWEQYLSHDLLITARVSYEGEAQCYEWTFLAGRVLAGLGVMEQARAHGDTYAGQPVRAGLFIPNMPQEWGENLREIVQLAGLDPDNDRERDTVAEWITDRLAPSAAAVYSDAHFRRFRASMNRPGKRA